MPTLHDSDKEMLVYLMDLGGWEQDGEGCVFIWVGGDGRRIDFGTWDMVFKYLANSVGMKL